jgi:hypothetical protein
MTDTTMAPRVQTRGADRTTTTTAPTRFADLGLSPRVVDALAKRGLVDAFPIQSLVMPDALAGRDILAKSRTGSGKTLAFAIPLVETLTPSDRAPTALILAPTRELASQVTEEFRAIADVRHLKVAAVYGGVGIGPPKVLGAPKPRSSIRMITTFGAPAGALTWKAGGAFTLRASSSVYSGRFGSGSAARCGRADPPHAR